MLSRFHLIPERYTDGQTDRFAISISRVSVLTRDKNYPIMKFMLPIAAAAAITITGVP